MDSSLLMSDQYLFEWSTLELVKKRKHRSAWIIEKEVHPFLF
jgi:hypothetical protein